MIHVYYGDNRAAALAAAKKVLGENYEVIDAEELTPSDLPNIFLGATLFEEKRKILIKSLAEHKENFEEIEKYLDTEHEIVVLDNKLNGTWTSVKSLKKSTKAELKEFKLPETVDRFLAFKIFDTALINSKNAYEMLKKAELTEDPFMMTGAWATSAIKNFKKAKTAKNRTILKELARIDALLKNSKFSAEPWMLLESFILRMGTF